MTQEEVRKGVCNNMAPSQHENGVAVSETRLLLTSMISVILSVGSAVCAKAQDAQPNNTNESWTATTQTSVENTNPSRKTESHAKSGNRSLDKQRVEVLGPNGEYQPNSDTEKETIEVNATTTRTVVRVYGWDGNGRRYLVQVVDEEAQSSTSGDTQVVRTTSNSDVNGNLQVVQRAVADTRKTSPDAQETKTTVYLADGNGGFAPSLRTQELQKRSADHRVEVKKTTLLPDGNGNWAVREIKENAINEDGKNRSSEERVSRPDINGRFSEVSRTVGKETETAAGAKSNTVETYSMDVPGVAGDGRLHLNQRATTVQTGDSGNKITERPTPGNPSDGLQVSAKTKYTVRYAASGTQQTKTIQTRDTNGTFSVVSVETEKSDHVPPGQVPKSPAHKPQ
jgi:hypothetical protein